MKSVLLGILAALVGCAIFFACLVGWYELTGQGSGVFMRRAETAESGTITEANADAGVTIVSPGTGSGQDAVSGSANNSNVSIPLVVVPDDVTDSASDASNAASDASGTAQGQDAAQQTAEAQNSLLNAFAEKIEKELSPTLGEGGHVRVAPSSRGITITLWEDNLVSRLSAGQTNGETEKIWNDMKDRLRTMTLTYYSRRSEEGVPDAHIVANLLNEQRQDDIILSYEDGALVHDGLDHD